MGQSLRPAGVLVALLALMLAILQRTVPALSGLGVLDCLARFPFRLRLRQLWELVLPSDCPSLLLADE